MASTYVNNLRLNEMATGDGAGTWGTTTNTNLELIGEALGYGTEAITTNADTHTSTVADGSTDAARAMYIKYTGTLDSACTITIGPNTMKRVQFIENATSGSQNIIISQGSGANITIPPGDVKVVYLDGAGSGAAVVDAFASLSVVDLKVQDDLTVTDDLIVNGDIDLEGNMDVNGSLETDALSLNGTTVTSTAAELNILDGVTSTAAEINLLDGSSANTVVNSKAVIYGSSGEVAGTLSTAAQPNITSLGTLTTLTVDDITINGSTISDSGDLTLDVGGDKSLPYFPIEEDNPFLGWRGIRITLDHPEIFLVQVRAMLRANQEHRNLEIMLPMISNVSEVDESIRLINQAYFEVQAEIKSELGPNYDHVVNKLARPKVGIMLEVPSVIFQIEELAKRVDFFSVGSNDLTQYLLAVDRNNVQVANLHDAYHPAVLRALDQIAKQSAKYSVPLSLCGELSGQPAGALLLLAMGFDKLSMNGHNIARIKWVIRHIELTQAKVILSHVLTLSTAKQVHGYLNEQLELLGLGGFVRAGM